MFGITYYIWYMYTLIYSVYINNTRTQSENIHKCIIYLYELWKQVELQASGALFCSCSQQVQINFIFSENVSILCLSILQCQQPKSTAKLSKRSRKCVVRIAFKQCPSGSPRIYNVLLSFLTVAQHESGTLVSDRIQSIQLDCSNRTSAGKIVIFWYELVYIYIWFHFVVYFIWYKMTCLQLVGWIKKFSFGRNLSLSSIEVLKTGIRSVNVFCNFLIPE